jgi:hypothetical protein
VLGPLKKEKWLVENVEKGNWLMQGIAGCQQIQLAAVAY